VALKEARSAMGEEAKKILADNNRMFEELKFHHNEAADMQAEKNALVTNLTTAKRDINIFGELCMIDCGCKILCAVLVCDVAS